MGFQVKIGMFLRVKELSPEGVSKLGGEVSMAYRDVGHRLRDEWVLSESRKFLPLHSQYSHTSLTKSQ